MLLWFKPPILLWFKPPTTVLRGHLDGALAAALEFTDGAALANAWQGTFIGASASLPDPTWARYAVAFYVEPPRQLVPML